MCGRLRYSCIKTKHQAVYVELLMDDRKPIYSHSQKIVTYDTRAHSIDSLHFHLRTFDWSQIIALNDIQLVYDQFLIVVKHFVEACIPVKTVRLGRRNPDFITPHIN
jgi:hypothetical protein